MNRTLIFGGAGFIGKHLCGHLLSLGRQVISIDLNSSLEDFAQYSNYSEIIVDIATFENFSELLADNDSIVYLTCTLLPMASNDEIEYDISSNLLPVIRLLEAARKKAGIRIVFSSSGGTIYGVGGNPIQKEDDPTNPVTSYGIVKLAIEKYLGLYSHLYNLKTIALRIANPYGLGQRKDRLQGAVGVFVQKVLAGEPITIWGDGSVIRDYLYIDDLSKAFVAALNYQGNVKVFNIGSSVGTSINQLLGLIFKITKKQVTVSYQESRQIDISQSCLNTELAQQELGWFPAVPLVSGISIMLGGKL